MVSKTKFIRKDFLRSKANNRTKNGRKWKKLVQKHRLKKRYRYRAFLSSRKFNAKNTIGTLNKLNFDCLVHITYFLQLNDLINLDKISKDFSSVTRQAYKRYKSFNFNSISSLTFQEGRVVLNKIGPYITSIKIHDMYQAAEDIEAFIDLMLQLFTNLENLSISRWTSFELLLKMSKLFPTLKSIEFLWLFDIEIEKLLETATVLQNLNIRGPDISGRCISKIKNLVSLNFYGCQYLQPNYFTDICLNNTNLVKLDISYCRSLTSKSVTDITTNLLKLEELSISYETVNSWTSSDYLEFANLPNLKKLQIGCSTIINDDFLKILAKKDLLQSLDISGFEFPMNKNLLKTIVSFNKLEVLKMNFCKHAFNDEVLLQLATKGYIKELHIQGAFEYPNQKLSLSVLTSFVEKSPNIRLLDISYSRFIPDDFFYMLSKILKRLNRQHLLTVFVYNYKYSTDNQFNPDLIAEYSPWIRLNFSIRARI